MHNHRHQSQRLCGLDRLRDLMHLARSVDTLGLSFALLGSAWLLTACPADSQEKPPPRFVGVQAQGGEQAARSFCERSLPGDGAQAVTFTNPPERPIPGTKAPTLPAKAWRWINLWATWCEPCMEEIPLLGRWEQSLKKDGIPFALELWSADDDEPALLKAMRSRKLPGQVRWMRSSDDLTPFLEGLQVAQGAALPIHVLVDTAGKLRCVRVGAVHEGDYGAIKAMLVGG